MSYRGIASEYKGSYGSGSQFPYPYSTEGGKFERGGFSAGEKPFGSSYPGDYGTYNQTYGYGETPQDQSNYANGGGYLRPAGSGYTGAYTSRSRRREGPSLQSPSRLYRSRSPRRRRYRMEPEQQQLPYGSNGNGYGGSYSNGSNGNGSNGKEPYGGYPPSYTSSPGVQQPYTYLTNISGDIPSEYPLYRAPAIDYSKYGEPGMGPIGGYYGGMGPRTSESSGSMKPAAYDGNWNRFTAQHCLGRRSSFAKEPQLEEYEERRPLSPLRKQLRERFSPLRERIMSLMPSEQERLAKLESITEIGKLVNELRKLSVIESERDSSKAADLAVAANDLESMVKEKFTEEAIQRIGNVI